MDETLHNRIKKGLLNYETSIEETDEHYDELAAYGRYSADAPYGLKYLLPFWMGSLEREGFNSETFRAEYARITRKLTSLEEKRGINYREKLLSDLKRHVDCYPDLIDNFAELEPLLYEIIQDLAIRSTIEILLMELERDYTLTDIKEKVSLLDEALKSKYIQNIDDIIECCPEAESPLFPARFWWRHPLKLLKEKQAMQTNS